MSDINEKDILNSIKRCVENETPDVWDKIKNAEKCRYTCDKKSLITNIRNYYLPVAAAALCIVIAFTGIRTRFNNSSESPSERQNELVAEKSGYNYGPGSMAPGAPEDSAGRDVVIGSPDIFQPFTRDADAIEAGEVLKINIIIPSWLPDGYTKISSKLFSFSEDFTQPYMYSIEYSNVEKKILNISISRYMSEEEKLKSQPGTVPGDKGTPADGGEGNVVSPDSGIIVPPLPPDTPVNSDNGYNSSEPAAPPASDGVVYPTVPAGKDTPQSSSGGSSTGSVGTGTAEPVSVDFTEITVNGITVSLTVTSTNEYGTAAAYWVNNGGSYNICADGISKDDMIKIIESMIK